MGQTPPEPLTSSTHSCLTNSRFSFLMAPVHSESRTSQFQAHNERVSTSSSTSKLESKLCVGILYPTRKVEHSCMTAFCFNPSFRNLVLIPFLSNIPSSCLALSCRTTLPYLSYLVVIASALPYLDALPCLTLL